MATMETKLSHQIEHLEQTLLYRIFIDLRKALDTMDCKRCLNLLWAYGVGPKMLRLIKAFWNQSILACRACGNYGRTFSAKRGMMEGGTLL